MLIRVDAREGDLIKQLEFLITNIPAFKEIKLNVESLPIGDVIICNNENNLLEDKIIIERKTIKDLAASIKDGRYEEQSYRLNGLDLHNHNIIYLIEGNVNINKNIPSYLFKDSIDKLTIYSAMFSILYYKGFSLLRSLDIEESATMICNMCAKMIRMKNKECFYKNTIITETSVDDNININESEKDYCKVVKKNKKDNITSENIGEIMLSQIPGISSQTAIAILTKFISISNLIKNIELNDKCLDDVFIIDKNNKSRKINKNCIINLKKYLK
jgi:ERCC4-type nuclease